MSFQQKKEPLMPQNKVYEEQSYSVDRQQSSACFQQNIAQQNQWNFFNTLVSLGFSRE
jgi:hypothetical protein